MAGQAPTRRELLQALTLASAASAFPGFSRWSYVFAQQPHQHPAPAAAIKHATYHPSFFSSHEYATVTVLAELILPATPEAPNPKSRPGATDAGVAEFIDFMVFSDPSLQPPFRRGLAWLDQAAASSFVKLDPPHQHQLLDRLAYKAQQHTDEKDQQAFFQLVRRYTVMGFYTTRLGLEAIDYPGLTFYASSPGCDHPEHAQA